MLFASPATTDTIRALIIKKQGFGAQYTVIITRNPQNSIGSFRGPYSMLTRSASRPVAPQEKHWV